MPGFISVVGATGTRIPSRRTMARRRGTASSRTPRRARTRRCTRTRARKVWRSGLHDHPSAGRQRTCGQRVELDGIKLGGRGLVRIWQVHDDGVVAGRIGAQPAEGIAGHQPDARIFEGVLVQPLQRGDGASGAGRPAQPGACPRAAGPVSHTTATGPTDRVLPPPELGPFGPARPGPNGPMTGRPETPPPSSAILEV
jgi:hypothetical protein